MRRLRAEAGQAGRHLLLLRLRLLRLVRVLLVRVLLVPLVRAQGVVAGADVEGLLLEPPLLELRLPAPLEEDAEHRLRLRLRACLAPSSWWSTNRERAADDSTSLHTSEERNRVSPALQILSNSIDSKSK